MNFREQIKNTSTFQKLNIIQREIVLSKTNVQNLEHGVKVVKNIGWDNWVKICQYSERNKNIVRELVVAQLTIKDVWRIFGRDRKQEIIK